MRWRPSRFPYSGENRTRRRFLVWPMCIDKEWRWLEWATWQERYLKNAFDYAASAHGWWMKTRWLDV